MQFHQLNRREFIAGIGGGAATWPVTAHAQQGRNKPLIGFLAAASPESAMPQTNAMFEGMRDLGYVEGRDYETAWKWAYGVMDRLPALAQELLPLKPTVIVANPTPAIVAMWALTKTIPIVSFMIADEIRLGLVASHARPGGNVTGMLMRVEGMVSKQLELATQTIPNAKRIGLVLNPTSEDTAAQRREAEAVEAALAVTCVFADIRTPADLDPAFRRLAGERVDAFVVLFDALFFQERRKIAALAAAARLPGIYASRDHIDAGGLISYGISFRANARRLTSYIDRILKGARPADLPLEFPTRLELVINLKAARALNIDIPPMLLGRADEVIE